MFTLLLELPTAIQLLVLDRLSANDLAVWAGVSRSCRQLVAAARPRSASVSLALSNRRSDKPKTLTAGPKNRIVRWCKNTAEAIGGRREEAAAERRGLSFTAWLATGSGGELESLTLAVRQKLSRPGSDADYVPRQLAWQPPLTRLSHLTLRLDQYSTIVCVRNVIRGATALRSLCLALPQLPPEQQHPELGWLIKDMAPQLTCLEVEAAGLMVVSTLLLSGSQCMHSWSDLS